MDRAETGAVLSILRAAYPNFYSKMDRGQMERVLELWCEMFEHDNIAVVKAALYRLIETHSGYPPDIAALKSGIRELVAAATGEPTDEELWQILKQAVANGTYGSEDEFERLPPVLQRYLGSPSALRDLAMTDIDTLSTVVHGQFLKQIGTIKNREEAAASLSPAAREYISGVFAKNGEGGMRLSEAGWNARRNEVLERLEEKK